MRVLAITALAFLGPALPLLPVQAGELRVAAWNLEHLDDSEGGGCIGRSAADYEALAGWIADLDADVVAFQEVENVAAARRVFPEGAWNVEMSSRPAMQHSRPCRDRPEEMLGHLGTGFAIRRGIAYRRHGDLEALGLGKPFQRWGTDISVTAGGRELRLLSVHLRTGCWGARQDGDSRRGAVCAALREQVTHLRAWADARLGEGNGVYGPWRLQQAPGAARRLGVGHAVAEAGAARSPDGGEGCSLRPPLPGLHRPSGSWRRGGGDGGSGHVSGVPAPGRASRPLCGIRDFPGRITGGQEAGIYQPASEIETNRTAAPLMQASRSGLCRSIRPTGQPG